MLQTLKKEKDNRRRIHTVFEDEAVKLGKIDFLVGTVA